MSLPDRILAIVTKSTPQAPMRDSDIYSAVCKKGRIETGEMAVALETMTTQRLLSTARITRGGITQDVYWPTGRKTPALTGNKKEPLAVPHPTEPDTHGSRLIKLIIAHGPIIAADLAEKAGVVAKNIDPYLASAVKHGQIHTRMGYVPELGRERKHYMTATQAQEWDDRSEKIEVQPVDEPGSGHVMNHPLAQDGATRARMAELESQIAALKTRIHDQANDIAAANLIFAQLATTLKVQHIADIPAALDDLTHALATRAMTTSVPIGKPALLLIDSADLTEVEMLGDDDDAQAMAMSSIELGHAARVLVVNIVGEAQRKVVWKEFA